MRAYVRSEGKRMVAMDTRQIWQDKAASDQGRRPPVSMAPGSEAFAHFVRAFSNEVERQGTRARKLAPLAHCQRLDLVRVHVCGAEQPRTEAWCGQPYCGDCARRRATEAVRYVRQHWLDERVGVAQVRIGRPGGLELPSSEAVATVRTAWARATKAAAEATGLPRVEHVPRALLTPDGLTFFFRRPEASEAELATALQAACAGVGLSGVQVWITSRESAAMRVYRGLLVESQRFQENVLVDLERILAFPPFERERRERAMAAAARRWVSHVEHRQRSARRQLVLGGKSSLPLPTKRQPDSAERPCPSHGPDCRVESLLVRDHARRGSVVWRSRGAPFEGTRPGKQALAEFCARVTDQTPRCQNEQTQILWRQAG